MGNGPCSLLQLFKTREPHFCLILVPTTIVWSMFQKKKSLQYIYNSKCQTFNVVLTLKMDLVKFQISWIKVISMWKSQCWTPNINLQTLDNFKNASYIILKICRHFEVGTTLSKQRNVNFNPLQDNSMDIQKLEFVSKMNKEIVSKCCTKKIRSTYCIMFICSGSIKLLNWFFIQITFWIEEN